MSNLARSKPWQLSRRTFLRGAGAALALPALDCMASSPAASEPKRLAAIYFPFGVSIGSKDDTNKEWYWFPHTDGHNYQFNQNLKPLEPLRDEITILGGLSHPEVRRIGGHDSGDTFLTGCHLLKNNLRNTQSMDQVAADHFDGKTRISSLVMSTDGGVGEPTRSSTLSYNKHGRPIPALNQPRQIFERFFGEGDSASARNRRRLQSATSMLDLVLDDAVRLRGKLGRFDQEKFDEYLDSVRQVEKRVERAQAWVDIPKPGLSDADRERLRLDSDAEVPTEYISTMYDLMYLAFRTDSTRVATYQIASMGDATTLGGKFPQLLGLGSHVHSLCHDWNKKEGFEPLGKWDQFLAQRLADFLTRMRNTPAAPESDVSLLDQTTVLYGCSNSSTHNNNNYPLILAGGKNLGFKHGQYQRFADSTPLNNVYTTMLQQVGVSTQIFGDATGNLAELLG